MQPLTEKQEKFCNEFLIDLNATQAAIRCGYSPKTANEQASRLLANVNIKDRIEAIRKPLIESTGLNQEWVLNRFKDISNRCMTAEPVMIRDDEGNMIESGDYKFDSSGANKATEMIAKHLGFFETHNKQKTVQAPVINILPPSV